MSPRSGGRPGLSTQMRFLTLKNLAALLAGSDVTAPRALRLYAAALQLDAGDVVLWHRMGTLVRPTQPDGGALLTCLAPTSSGCKMLRRRCACGAHAVWALQHNSSTVPPQH